ncbi:MAG: HI0074 family nucleotidyltransferase substrate-binding subunit [Saprospiraceae bacterium]|nr:HI0074 family nucleotidyltransferase substrate-binding subunit [Saprospiraceae bacterium]
MSDKEYKWKQRLTYFGEAIEKLQAAESKKDLTFIETAGVIKIYEFTFELAWKTIRDFLEEKKVDIIFPRDVIKAAFHYELINDGEIWMDMLEKRKFMNKTFNVKNAQIAYNLIINDYFKELYDVFMKLKKEV